VGNARAEASESKRSAGESAAAQAETVEELKSCQQDLREARAEAKGAVAAAREAYEERAKVLEAQFNARAAALAERYVALGAGLLAHASTNTVFRAAHSPVRYAADAAAAQARRDAAVTEAVDGAAAEKRRLHAENVTRRERLVSKLSAAMGAKAAQSCFAAWRKSAKDGAAERNAAERAAQDKDRLREMRAVRTQAAESVAAAKREAAAAAARSRAREEARNEKNKSLRFEIERLHSELQRVKHAIDEVAAVRGELDNERGVVGELTRELQRMAGAARHTGAELERTRARELAAVHAIEDAHPSKVRRADKLRKVVHAAHFVAKSHHEQLKAAAAVGAAAAAADVPVGGRLGSPNVLCGTARRPRPMTAPARRRERGSLRRFDLERR
jgi:hypothetical protein